MYSKYLVLQPNHSTQQIRCFLLSVFAPFASLNLFTPLLHSTHASPPPYSSLLLLRPPFLIPFSSLLHSSTPYASTPPPFQAQFPSWLSHHSPSLYPPYSPPLCLPSPLPSPFYLPPRLCRSPRRYNRSRRILHQNCHRWSVCPRPSRHRFLHTRLTPRRMRPLLALGSTLQPKTFAHRPRALDFVRQRALPSGCLCPPQVFRLQCQGRLLFGGQPRRLRIRVEVWRWQWCPWCTHG